MSYFGTALKALLDRKGMKAVRLADISGVGQPKISRYIRGDQAWVDQEDLKNIAKAISTDPTEQAELVRARLLDECHGPGSDLVRIEIGGRLLKDETPAAYQVKLPQDLERAFLTIREWVMKDARVREIVAGLGDLLATTKVEEVGRVAEQDKIDRLTTSRPQLGEKSSAETVQAAPPSSGATQSTEPVPHQTNPSGVSYLRRSGKSTRPARKKS